MHRVVDSVGAGGQILDQALGHTTGLQDGVEGCEAQGNPVVTPVRGVDNGADVTLALEGLRYKGVAGGWCCPLARASGWWWRGGGGKADTQAVDDERRVWVSGWGEEGEVGVGVEEQAVVMRLVAQGVGSTLVSPQQAQHCPQLGAPWSQ